METIRAFIAIPLPNQVLERLGALQSALKRQLPDRYVRWIRPAGIHLTLKFLGDMPGSRIPEVEHALAAVSDDAPRFRFQLHGLGCFPDISRPRVVWVGIQEPTGRLAGLQTAVEAAVRPIGFAPERRAFTPHLTLGRSQRRASASDLERIGQVVVDAKLESPGEFTADRFSLIRSVLKPEGAEYTTLRSFLLRSA